MLILPGLVYEYTSFVRKKCVVFACVRTHLASTLPDRPSCVQDAHEADGALLHAGPVIASVCSVAECATQENALQESVEARRREHTRQITPRSGSGGAEHDAGKAADAVAGKGEGGQGQ